MKRSFHLCETIIANRGFYLFIERNDQLSGILFVYLLHIIVISIIVVKAEYYWGTKCWWIFLVLGILGVIASLFIDSVFVSAICGVFAFSSFWTIKEIFEQEERVQKGWFPRNPKRKYPWDDSEVK